MRAQLAVNDLFRSAIVVVYRSVCQQKMSACFQSSDLSKYVKTLPPEAKERYFRKLTYKGVDRIPDPYLLGEDVWKNDPCLWPELEFAQVFMYLIETPAMFNPESMKAYKSLEAYKYVESGHVQEVLHHDVQESPYCLLKAGVLPSMRTRDKPHQAWVALNKSTADVFCAHCTCLAGLGEMCSHIAAVLFKIELGVRFGLTQKSVTSEACKWNKVFRKQIETSTIDAMQELLNSNRKKKVETSVPSSHDPLPPENVLKSFKEVCPNASFFSLIPPLDGEETAIPKKPCKTEQYPQTVTSFFNEDFRNLTDEELSNKCEQISESYKCTDEQVSKLFQTTTNQSISPLWYQHRQGRVTGTKAHDILTRRDSTAPDNLVMKIMNYKSYDLSKKSAVKWGLDTESEARTAYANHQSTAHKTFSCKPSGFLIHSEQPFFGATADGVISCLCCGKGTLEIKCPFKHKDKPVEEATSDPEFCLNSNLHLKVKHRYFTQIQFQMIVFGTSYCDFVVYTKPEPTASLVIVRVSRDECFCDQLFRKCSEFHTKYVLPEILTRKLEQKPTSTRLSKTSKGPVCLCNEPEYGKMIQCSCEECDSVWFHYSCVNIKRKPKGRWFCPRCKP